MIKNQRNRRTIKQLLNLFTYLFFFLLFYNSPLFSATVAINQLVLHPALDKTRQGIIDELTQNPPNTATPLDIIFESAQGQLVLAAQIAQKFRAQDADIIVAIGTTAAQASHNAIKGSSVSVVFSSVTDPLEARLLKNIHQPEGQVTGTSNFIPVTKQLLFMKEILPDLKSLGILYNPGEANSASLIKKLKKEATALNINIVEATALKTSDVSQAARWLVSKTQAIFITNDNTALAAFESISKIATVSKTPLFVSDTDMVEKGALAALGPDQYLLGRQTGRMVRRLLEGSPVKTVPVEFPKDTGIILNQKIASKIGFTFKEKLRKSAQKIIEEKL